MQWCNVEESESLELQKCGWTSVQISWLLAMKRALHCKVSRHVSWSCVDIGTIVLHVMFNPFQLDPPCLPFWGLNLNRWFCLYRASTLHVQPQLKSPLFPALQGELVGGGNPFFSSFSPLKWSGIGLSNVFYPLKTQGSAAQRLERQRSKDTGCPTLQFWWLDSQGGSGVDHGCPGGISSNSL